MNSWVRTYVAHCCAFIRLVWRVHRTRLAKLDEGVLTFSAKIALRGFPWLFHSEQFLNDWDLENLTESKEIP